MDDIKKRRQIEIESWFRQFAKHCNESFQLQVTFDGAAAATINAAYWEVIENTIRPRLATTSRTVPSVNRYHIASTFEIIVAIYKPIIEPEENNEDLNARLAFFVANVIIMAWQDDDVRKHLYISNAFVRDHIIWLKDLGHHKNAILSIFQNASNWYLMDALAHERNDKQKLTNQLSHEFRHNSGAEYGHNKQC